MVMGEELFCGRRLAFPSYSDAVLKDAHPLSSWDKGGLERFPVAEMLQRS